MRRIVAGLFMSLDGAVDGGPDGWHEPYLDAELMEGINAGVAAADAIVLGTRTYLEFAELWPRQPRDNPMARFMNDSPKYVASSTLSSVEWSNSRLLSGDLSESLRELRRQPGKDILIPGSPQLVGSVLRAGMLDELSLAILPIVLGSGACPLGEPNERVPLVLTESRALRSGVLSVTYRPTNTDNN
ncbi:MAG: dihydrofolate reductase family protein [Nocardioidaceae bacterium]